MTHVRNKEFAHALPSPVRSYHVNRDKTRLHGEPEQNRPLRYSPSPHPTIVNSSGICVNQPHLLSTEDAFLFVNIFCTPSCSRHTLISNLSRRLVARTPFVKNTVHRLLSFVPDFRQTNLTNVFAAIVGDSVLPLSPELKYLAIKSLTFDLFFRRILSRHFLG